jgi:hypothetical protein
VNPIAQERELEAGWDDTDLAEATGSTEGPGSATGPDDASESLSDATQLYLHRIGLKRLFTQDEELRVARSAAA